LYVYPVDELVRQGQWWWLLIPLGTGVFALIGSWLGAKLGKTTEHAQWLRNRKVDSYTAYVNACKHIVRGKQQGVTEQDVSKFEASFTQLSLIDAELVATKKVQARLDEFNDAFFLYVTTPDGDTEKLTKDYKESLRRLNEAFRKDLKIKD
jgi:hypothetical protein